MGALEPGHLVVILAIALVIFGPGKVGELGGTLGRAVREFRDISEGRTSAPALPARSCASCRAPISAEANFCSSCGAEVNAPKSDAAA